MANRRTTETAENNTVFVDTSFDTHFAMLVCKSDTVSDFKKKIASEHMHCFPKIKDIHIHSLKVKREASFYLLPDNMLVWSALHSAEGNWFLSVDASSSSMCHFIQNPSGLDLTKCTTMDLRNVDSSCRGLSSDINRTQQTLEKTTDIQNSYLSGKNKTPSKRKRKRGRTELGQDVRADQSGSVPSKVPDVSAGLMDAQETVVKIQDNETSTGNTKRKNKKKSANDVVSEKREPAKENQHSSGNGHIGVPIVEKVKDSETTDNTYENAKEEINMKMLTTTDVQEDFPVTDQKNDIGIHKASSQVPACQSEEKLEEKHEIAVKTDHLAGATGEINFKDYFVHCEVKNADQSSMEMKSMKKVKTNGLPSVSISTEVHSSSKLSADHKSKNKSHVRKHSSGREGDLSCNSDSSRRSSRVLENVEKDSSTSERLETNLPKPKEKKNASVVKSSLEKLPGESGKRMELKTPKKKIVLKKPGTLFEDVSGDENGTAHSSGSTRSPSKSPTMSDHTKSESDLSQDSIGNGIGSVGAKGQSTAGKGRSKLDILLDSGKEISIQKILRSSKRFKKAKLIALQNEANEAVQNESQPIEFIPDSFDSLP